jgi:hypothetical protein
LVQIRARSLQAPANSSEGAGSVNLSNRVPCGRWAAEASGVSRQSPTTNPSTVLRKILDMTLSFRKDAIRDDLLGRAGAPPENIVSGSWVD